MVLDPVTGAVLRIINLQYNPDTLTRTLQIKGVGQETGDRTEAAGLKGPLPRRSRWKSRSMPPTPWRPAAVPRAFTRFWRRSRCWCTHRATCCGRTTTRPAGADIEIIAVEASLTVFVFGPKAHRLPVRFTEFSIPEDAFDALLNPIRAKVSLGMRVLSIDDVNFDEKSGSVFMTYLRAKEQLASQSTPGTLGALGITGNSIKDFL